MIERIAPKHSYGFELGETGGPIRYIRGSTDLTILPAVHGACALLTKPNAIHWWGPEKSFRVNLFIGRDASLLAILVKLLAIDREQKTWRHLDGCVFSFWRRVLLFGGRGGRGRGWGPLRRGMPSRGFLLGVQTSASGRTSEINLHEHVFLFFCAQACRRE